MLKQTSFRNCNSQTLYVLFNILTIQQKHLLCIKIMDLTVFRRDDTKLQIIKFENQLLHLILLF